jgi:hypothetical protein
MIRATLSLIVFAAATGIIPLQAQTGDTVSLSKIVQFSIPNSPAFDFIGQSPDKVTRPTSSKAFATALLSGLNASGKFQQGVAIDVAPWQLLSPNMDLRDYQSRSGFWFSNLTLSLGTVKSSGDSSDTNLGLGARVVLFDRTDPSAPASRRAGDSAILSVLLRCLPRTDRGPRPVTPNEIPAVKKCVKDADTTFRNTWRDAHWNDYALSVSVATGWGLPKSQWNDPAHLGGAIWALAAAPLCLRSAAPGLCRKGQWLVKAQYQKRDSLDAVSIREFITGVRATLGSSVFGMFMENLYRRRTNAVPGSKKSRNEWSAGVEFKLGEENWVTTGVGSRYDDLTKSSKAVVLAGLRFNVSPKQQLKTVIRIR